MDVFLTYLGNEEFVLEQMIAIALIMIRMPRQKHFWIRLPICIIVCLASSIRWDYSYFYIWWGVLIYAAWYVVILALFLFSIKICWKISWSQAIFYTCCSYCMQHVAYLISEIVYTLFWEYGTMLILEHYYTVRYITLVIVLAVVYSLIYLFVMRPISKNQDRISFRGLVAPSVLIVVSTMTLNLYRQTWIEYSIIEMLYPVCLCIMGFFFYTMLLRINRLQSEKEETEQYMQMQAAYGRMSRENIQLINMRCHDIKHQLSTLTATGDEKLKAEAEKLKGEVDIYESIAKTGCDALDIILTDKCFNCKSKGVTINYLVDDGSLDGIAADDIYAIFCNAIDNAAEYAATLKDPARRTVNFRVTRNGNIVSIRFDNYYDGVIRMGKDKFPASTKEGRLHGLGLKSIRYIAERYDGSAAVRAENGIFTLSIILAVNYVHERGAYETDMTAA
ncbi:MAG: ATP-binding protein [Clostridia bacterium]|nr:ATP-binding protein [Clostridia bacterium]